MEKVRVDKWLWSVRIFKSRTLATDACKGGKVKIGGDTIKPSYLIQKNEVVTVKKDGFNFEYRAVELIEKRVGAPIAATCVEDVTPETERNKYDAWFTNQAAAAALRERGAGRPTKKDRREIDRFGEE